MSDIWRKIQKSGQVSLKVPTNARNGHFKTEDIAKILAKQNLIPTVWNPLFLILSL